MIHHIVVAEACKELLRAFDLGLFDDLQLQTFHRPLRLVDEKDVLDHPLVEGGRPVGRAVPHGRRNMEDKTPSGVELSYHAANQANERRFTLKNIDDIILNNKKNRKKEFHLNGEIRWLYQDKRGNTVITNEDGTRIITVYSHPASANNEKYIPKN